MFLRLLALFVGSTGMVAEELNLATARTDDELISVMRRMGIDVVKAEESAA